MRQMAMGCTCVDGDWSRDEDACPVCDGHCACFVCDECPHPTPTYCNACAPDSGSSSHLTNDDQEGMV